MRTKLSVELFLIGIVLIPFIYLFMLWNNLPVSVPIHWNINGEIDRFGTKTELLMIPVLPLLTYLIFLVVPKIDKRSQLEKMGDKYHRLKFAIVLFMSVLATYIIYMVKQQSISNPNIVLGLIGLLFAVIGNYFSVLKQNRFIGIRTPWTLKNETVWEETHKMAGKYWVIGGILIIISSLFMSAPLSVIIFLSITLIVCLVPIVFSYREFRRLKKLNH